jgi:hypothetical protein
VFTDSVRAGNLKAAQDAYAPSRMPWERIEPITELVEDTDAKTDSRVDDFAGVDDPKFTGWHRLEYLLFDKNTLEGAVPFADQLDADIANLQKELPNVKVEPINVANGAAELIEEVSQGKLTGEEDRYAKTDLWDFDANLQGSQVAVDKLSGPLKDADAALLGKITAGFSQLFDTMRPLRQGDGWVNFCPGGKRVPVAALPVGDRAAAGRRRAQGAARRAVGEPVPNRGCLETEVTVRPPRRGISRRGFVTGALGTGVAVGAGGVLAGCSSPEPASPPVSRPEFIPFEGSHQAGITTLPIPEQGMVASFNLQVRDRAGLKATLQELTEEIRGLMAGKPPQTRDSGVPARRLRHPRRQAPRRQPLGSGRRRRFGVRRPVRAG